MIKRKIRPLVRVPRKEAHAVVCAGKRSVGMSNPYRRHTTKWYLWNVGVDNSNTAADTLLDLMISLNYPIGDEDEYET